MAGKLGVLTLNLVARIGQFVEPMKNAERQTKTSASNMARDFEEADKGISMSAKNIGLSLAGVAASYVSIDRLINTQRTFDKLNAGLITATGSAEVAAAAFDSLQKFAKETPYGLEQSVGAFIKLTNLGLKPSEAALTSYGNTAAAMGKDLDQMIEAVADATTGEFERLKEFGIKASQENGKVSLTFKGQTTTIRNNAKEIEKYLLNLGNVDFAGAMENRMKTLDGSIANLEDTIDGLFLKVSQSGIGDAIKAGVDGASESLETLGDNLDTVGDIALVVGAIFAGRYASSMVGSIQKTVAASIEQKQALVAEQAESVKLLGVQAQRARQNVALALTEVNLARADFNNATTTATRAAATQRLTAANIALAISEKQASIATTAYTAATGAATVATSRLAAAKALLLGLTGGWVGLGITVASVAAGYLMMRDGADESTKSLRENNESVDDAIKKYNELDEVKRRAQLVSEKNTLQDLAKEYDEVNSKLITATYSFSRHNDMTSEQSKQVNALIAEYKKTGDIDQFSGKINALNFISQTSKDRFNTLGGSVKDAGNEFKNQKSFVDQMAPAVKGVGDQAKQTATETANLSAEIKKLLSINTDNALKSNYLNESVKRGVDPKLAEMLYEARSTSGLIGSGKKLSDDVLKSVFDRWKADQGLNKTLEERAKIEEKNKKLVEAQGNAMKVNAKVAANAAKYNFAAIEAKNKLPSGLLSAIHMQESRGNANAYNKSSGAAGGFQFLEGTAKQYGVKDRYNLAQSAEGAGKYMAYLLDLFKGDLDKAVSAYHAGEGNVQRGTNIGPVNRQYVKNIKGYLGGSSGVSFTEDYSFDDWLKEFEQTIAEQEKLEKELTETRKAVQVSYYNEWQNLEYDNQERIKEIEKAFATDPTERDRLLGLQQKAYEDDVANWIKAQDERVKAENEANQQIILARQNAFAMMNGPLGAMVQMGVEASARASMKPEEYQRWQLGNEQQDGYSQLADSLYSAREGIQNDEYTTDTEKYAKLNEAYKTYLDSKKALSESYSKQEQDLAQAQYEGQLSLWGNLLGQAQNTWSQMTQAVKDSEGEQSGAFKAMFLAQQMFAMGSALISTHLAATQVAADATIPFFGAKIAASKAMLAMGYANVGLIAGQTIAGMAHDGIDNIPKEGTWLLDKGERVVDSRTNADLKNMIANNNGGGSGVNIVVENYTSGQVQTKVDEEGRIRVIIRDEVDKYLPGQMNNSNSKIHKAVVRNTTATTKR
ncbi:transglycosylase SLT domain-containing protein [Acinetobacter lwoffii]|uniref:transglycosylase SLT domain-containing protein n=1 Tax=Acinetobacter lwoffii TaxID=28090 RepID=UPI00168D72C9|nr:transglycosylase SLT domain-containing protein [Acinetobacter lwoffii]